MNQGELSPYIGMSPAPGYGYRWSIGEKGLGESFLAVGLLYYLICVSWSIKYEGIYVAIG